ncbi:adenomatous polyposis coli protein-like isoform X2 [Copidosoma floridanum]|uniref:adenomatous polyposis coli protein-like isoform X2 n=1 Tax=Copidosoma floridanum TaxID=29053 RepID=UPI0006C9C435|nr:adenomatous polyposis coli protein-like isoform X2 [Copidosoma floridanum]
MMPQEGGGGGCGRPATVIPTGVISAVNLRQPATEVPDKQRCGYLSDALESPQLHQNNDQSCDRSSTKGDNRPSSSLQPHALTHFYESWPTKQDPSWLSKSNTMQNELVDPMSLSLSGNNTSFLSEMDQSQSRLGTRMDQVHNLLSTLGNSGSNSGGQEDMSATLLSMSNSVESCIVMRQSGCLPILIQLIHAPGQDPDIRERASRALYNVVHAKVDEKSRKREIRVLRLLEQLRDYCQMLRSSLGMRVESQDELERHPGSTIAALMKLSFDEAHRNAMCLLGALYAVTELIEMDHAAHGSDSIDQNCITLRRYAGMALTNLTFGDGNNKALLCSFCQFMRALVSQLRSPSDDLRQVTASVLRNLSWRADSSSKKTLRETGAVVCLMKAAMEGRKESTLKSILSALWNLSAHCRVNKVDICGVEGALAFLVDMLTYNAPSKTLAIVENAGGILRNVSSYIAVRDDYRAIVRERGCLQVLLAQLKSPSLTIVSNACGTLWNLSARCPQDQRLLWDLGAVPMLRSLVHSKHKMISMGSSAALKNLFSACPNASNLVHMDSTARGLGLPTLPSLAARKQKALEQEIDQSLAETCDNIEPSNSPTSKEDKFSFKLDQSYAASNRTGKSANHRRTHNSSQQAGSSAHKLSLNFPRSESRESMRSVTSTQSDTVFEKVNRQARHSMMPSESHNKQQSTSLHSAMDYTSAIAAPESSKGLAEKKYTLRYMNAIPERLKPGEPLPDLRGLNSCNSTISWTVTPNQDATASNGFLHSSVENNLAISNSCDQLSSNSKVFSNSESESFRNSVSSKSKSASTSNNGMNYGTYRKGSKKIASPIRDDLPKNHPPMNFGNLLMKHSEETPMKYEQNPEPERSETKPKIPEAKQEVLLNFNCTSKQNNFDLQSQNDVLTSKADSLRSTTPSLESMPTLEACNSLDSDSAIFEEDRNSERNLKISNFSLPIGNSCSTQLLQDSKTEKNEKACLKTNRLEHTTKKTDHIKSPELEQQLQDDDDFSEVTHTNDYYTVQETYTLEKKIQNDSQNTFVNDECSISQQCSSTLSYISVDDENSLAEVADKNLVEPSDIKSDNQPVTSSSSENFESFNSIERSEQALLELCIKTGMSKAETMLSVNVSRDEKSKSSDAVDALHKQMISANNSDSTREPIPQQMEGELTNKSQKQEEYRRQQDVDAAIASVDRLTAAFIQQSEAIRMKESLLSEYTWNDEDSPNEVSFPSISLSVPQVASFKSDLDSNNQSITLASLEPFAMEEHSSCAFQCSSNDSMTESKIIEMEAIKLAKAVVNVDPNQVSLASINLDEINPPSTMGSLISLTASIGLTDSHVDNSGEKDQPDSLPVVLSSSCGGRKKSLPIGVVARRALSHGQNRTASLENLLNECNSANHSQLDNVKPPSIMDELLDLADMENSMLSVASITSEIADSKDNDSVSLTNGDINFDLIKPVANVLSLTCMKYANAMQGSGSNSLSECLENINPPSLFNEVNQMDESTIESSTRCNDTMCSDLVDLGSDKTTKLSCALDERIEDVANDTDYAITPISSECCSSVESTPKRRLSKNQSGHLTPKQKRQLVKERYKTYTIAAEIIKKEQEDLKRQEQANANNGENTMKCMSVLKLTPKQRRQEDRARFQTQILDNSVLSKPVNNESTENETRKFEGPSEEKSIPVFNAPTPIKSGIPMLRKFSVSNRTYKMKPNSESLSSNTPTKCDNVMIKNESKGSGPFSTSNESELNLTVREAHENELIDQEESLSNSPDAKSQNFIVDVQDNLYEARNHYSESDNNDSDDLSGNEDEGEHQKPKGPRIVKPGTLRRDLSVESNSTDKSEPEPLVKGIRGRRKPLYSKSSTRCSTPQSSPLKQIVAGVSPVAIPPISRSNSSPIVRATRATTLRQNNSAQKCSGGLVSDRRVTGAAANSPSQTSSRLRTSIPQKSPAAPSSASARRQVDYSQKHSELPFKALERQGTFTKDEPEMDNVPTVVPASPYRGKPTAKTVKPAGNVSPKTSPVHGKSKISPRKLLAQRSVASATKLTKTTSVEKISVGTNIPILAKRASTNLCSPVVKSSSNYQIGSNAVSLGQRSNSNSSIVSNPSNQANRKVKETASKIATLWKKVEDSRKNQRYEKPDTRQWITPSAQVRSPRGEKDQTCNLFRSSTFEGITKISKVSSRGFISPTA